MKLRILGCVKNLYQTSQCRVTAWFLKIKNIIFEQYNLSLTGLNHFTNHLQMSVLATYLFLCSLFQLLHHMSLFNTSQRVTGVVTLSKCHLDFRLCDLRLCRPLLLHIYYYVIVSLCYVVVYSVVSFQWFSMVTT